MCDRRDLFCFICGLFTDSNHKISLAKNARVVTLYEEYFGKTFAGDQWYIPQVCCTTCYTELRLWKTKPHNSRSLPFTEPVAWLPQRIHRQTNCYFCLTNTAGYHFNIRNTIKYADVDSVIKVVMREKDDDIPKPLGGLSPDLSEAAPSTSYAETESVFLPPPGFRGERHFVSQEEFRDLVRDLELSKRQIELLGSRMQQWDFLEDNVTITFARSEPTNTFKPLYTVHTEEDNLVYCNDVNALFQQLDHNHNPKEWRLFIDGSTKSDMKISPTNNVISLTYFQSAGLKAVLLHNENSFPSVPLAYATDVKESYDSMSKIINALKYNTHRWKIVADFKVLTILNGMQGGNTKYPCFLCEWDSRAYSEHYVQKEWVRRVTFKVGEKNVLNIPLVDPSDIILPPLHIKLGLIKQFVKALDKKGKTFTYLRNIFPKLTDAKVKEGKMF